MFDNQTVSPSGIARDRFTILVKVLFHEFTKAVDAPESYLGSKQKRGSELILSSRLVIQTTVHARRSCRHSVHYGDRRPSFRMESHDLIVDETSPACPRVFVNTFTSAS
jgi:hypothetical protein